MLTISDTGVVEGNPGNTQKATFTVHRTGPTTSPATVKYKTVEGTANKVDYAEVVAPATLTIPAGQSDQQLTVAITGDATAEGPEGFSVVLSSPSGVGVIEDGTAEAIIFNDDAGALIVDSSVAEGNSGTKVMTFEIARLGPASAAASVNWSTSDSNSRTCGSCPPSGSSPGGPSSATAGSDYKAVTSQPLTWAAGDRASKTVSVTINGDTDDVRPRLVYHA